MIKKLKQFFKKEKGQGLVEYGLILALISVLSIGAVSSVGTSVTDTFNGVNNTLGNLVETPEEEFIWILSESGGAYTAVNEEGRGFYRYTGSETEVVIPRVIKGNPVTSYVHMFTGTAVEKVSSSNPNVTNIGAMFIGSTAKHLDLSGLDTRNVYYMGWMFHGSMTETVDFSGFDTRNVTSTFRMFENSNIKTIDLSSFSTKKLIQTDHMFKNAKASEGYARNASDADKFNASSDKPDTLTFITKP